MRSQIIGLTTSTGTVVCVSCASRLPHPNHTPIMSDVSAPHGLTCASCGDVIKPSVECRECHESAASHDNPARLRDAGFCSDVCRMRFSQVPEDVRPFVTRLAT